MLKDDYKVYEEKMKKSINATAADFASVRAGRANAAVRAMLAEHLGVAENKLSLIKGATSPAKIFLKRP